MFRIIIPTFVVLALTAASAPMAFAQSVRLTWDASPDAVAAYVVLQGTSPGAYTTERRLPGTGTFLDLSGLAAGTTYYFAVQAENAAGQRSTSSNELRVATAAAAPAPTPVGRPSGPALRAVPALPAPTGTVVHVSTVKALGLALNKLASNTTIVLAPGSYRLTSTLRVRGGLTNVGLRGATSNPADVVLTGPGLASTTGALDGVRLAGTVRGLVLANLTLRDFPGVPMILDDAHAPVLHNLRVHSDGRFLLARASSTTTPLDTGTIQYSRFVYQGTRNDLRNGLEMQNARGWRVRYNEFRNPSPSSTQRLGATVLAWTGSADTIVEGNTFVNCSREIVLGLSNSSPNQHSGGVVRNNMVVRSASVVGGAAAIAVLDSPRTQVLHNTALLQRTAPAAIEYRYADTTGVLVANNLTDAPVVSAEGATGVQDTNVTSAAATLFNDAANGDLRLLSTALLAIDAAAATGAVADDHGGDSRPTTSLRDVGADETTTFVYPIP